MTKRNYKEIVWKWASLQYPIWKIMLVDMTGLSIFAGVLLVLY